MLDKSMFATWRWFDDDVGQKCPVISSYVNTGPAHMPLGLADRLAHDERLARRGERDES